MRNFSGNPGYCYTEHALYTKKALFEDRAFESRVVISCCERPLFVPDGFGSFSSSPFPEDKSRRDNTQTTKTSLDLYRN
jgi:hypothetical protein